MKTQLAERYINLFANDRQDRYKWADEVWEILQSSYRDIGGLKGGGFKDKQDMIDKIPFWKIATLNGKAVAVAMYKDTAGRKRVAIGALKVPGAKSKVVDLMLSDLKMNRSWGEMSGPAWGFIKKNVPEEILLAIAIPIVTVQKLLPKDEILPAFRHDPKVSASDPFRDYYYSRELPSGERITKIAIGQPGHKVT